MCYCVTRCLKGGSVVKRFIRTINMFFYILLLCSCSVSGSGANVILLVQRDTTKPQLTQAFSVERVAEETIISTQKTVYTKASQKQNGGLSWLAKEIDSGSPAKEIKYYNIAYDYEGNELSKTYIPGSDLLIPSTPRIREFGAKMEVNTYFRPSFSRYGVNCKGCRGEFTGSGNTAIGIKLDVDKGVQQADGSWKPGITWEGYYIVAADKSIPFCSIIEISNHNYSGEGLSPNVPFKAIVLDRGGAITNNRLDFYIGSEDLLNKNVKVVSKRTPLAKIVRLGGLVYKNGKYSCKL